MEVRFAVDLAPHRAVALADDAAPAAVAAHPPKLTVVWLVLLLLVRQPHRAVPIAHLLGLGLCRVQTARAIDLRAVRTAVV